MDRKLALERLEELLALHKDKTERKYRQIFEQHQEQLVEDLLAAVLKLKKYYPVRILQFQIRRTDLYQKKYRIEVCGYNKKWYQDEERTTAYVEIEFLFEPFKELWTILEADLLKYMGAVSRYDIDNMVNELFISCYNRSSTIIRKDFLMFDEWLMQNKKSYRKPYRVMWGDYRGRTDMLFYQDKLGKDAKELQKACEDETKEGHQFFCFVESDLKNISLQQEHFAYLNMKKSNLTEVAFDRCEFGEGLFMDCVMDWCTYTDNKIYGCNFAGVKGYQLDFRGASIANTTFEGMKLRKGNFKGAELVAVDFKDCELDECSFQDATLSMVDLRTEKLEGIDLTGARLEQVYIYEKDMESLCLTDEQKKHVYVLAET